MSRQELIDAAQVLASDAASLAESANRLAATLRQAQPEAGSAHPAPATQAAESVPPAPSAAVDTNRCPKHNVPWEEGKWGPYCKQMTDDPAWGKQKFDRDGNPVLWCKLTPINAPDWVRVHGLPA